MTEIVIPTATFWMKLIVTPPLAVISLFAVLWGTRNFFRCVQMLRGVRPLPPNGTQAGASAGLVFFSIIVAIGAGAGYMLLGVLTTQPYIITDKGLKVGARPLHYQARFVPWNQILRVTCYYPFEGPHQIARLYIYTTQGRESLPSNVPLEPVYDFLSEHLPQGEMEPCK